ncbi:hemolysin family protein [uncultured Rummeliibacillus sp.]|uniref:hemolysin family protein n=1 Tax=uncultured Rummeliibacillus sp. TaxID=762292 RepID=UPI00262C1D43|nr:CNNM domain-containing protein [uncultured Rummeliibacillus sp.]
MEFIGLIICLLISFFFSGSETALTAINRMKVQLRANQGDRMSQKLNLLLTQSDRMITTILIVNNTVNILMPTLLTIIALRHNWQVSVATTILTIIIIIFGEVLPKTIAVTFADRLAYVVAPVIAFFVRILTPITWIVQGFTNLFIRILSNGTVTEATLTKEELRGMVDVASTEGTFDESESDRLKEMLDFPDKDVSDVMGTHRTDVIGLTIDATYDEVRNTILEYSFTRYPVYEESLDNVVGMFYSKKFVEWSLNPSKKLVDFIDEDPLFVVSTVSIEKVFTLMLTQKKHLAIVLDEYGGTLGIVSHEDIIEEMIGLEIEDESDEEEESLVYELTEDTLVCHGRLEIEEANEIFHVDIPQDHETVGGFVLEQSLHIPEPGETFDFENLHIVVTEVDDSRIIKLTITKQTFEEQAE